MVGALFDTNILIDSLNGWERAQEEIERYPVRALSVMSWIEVMTGVEEREEGDVRLFLSQFHLVPLTTSIVERSVGVRRERRIKLPDAVILATALEGNWLLVTRNTRDFPEEEGVVRVPYRI